MAAEGDPAEDPGGFLLSRAAAAGIAATPNCSAPVLRAGMTGGGQRISGDPDVPDAGITLASGAVVPADGYLDPVAGHIPGAVSAPSGQGLSPAVLEADEVVAYCGSGVVACVAVLELARAGRPDAKLYAGSWREWSRRGLPVACADSPELADHPFFVGVQYHPEASPGPQDSHYLFDRFVAEVPGVYTLLATAGPFTARKTIDVRPREVVHEIQFVGRGTVNDVHTSDLWVYEGVEDAVLVGVGEPLEGALCGLLCGADAGEALDSLGEVVDAAVAGDFSKRVNANFPDSELNRLAESVNNLVDTVDRGLGETGEVLSALARTDLTKRMEGHGNEGRALVLTGGQQHVELARIGVVGDPRGQTEQFVGRVAHRRDRDDHLVAGLLGLDDALGHALDALGIRDARASVLLHDETHERAPSWEGGEAQS